MAATLSWPGGLELKMAWDGAHPNRTFVPFPDETQSIYQHRLGTDKIVHAKKELCFSNRSDDDQRWG